MYDIRTHVSDTILTGWYLTNVQNSVISWKICTKVQLILSIDLLLKLEGDVKLRKSSKKGSSSK